MASCQQYENKPTLPQGQIVPVSCKAYPHLDMGVVDLKRIRLVPQAETWLKVDKGSNKFIFLQLPFLVKGVGTDKDEVALVDRKEAVTWKTTSDVESNVYISRARFANDEDDEDAKVCSDEDGKVCSDKVWTAEESCGGIKIKLRAKETRNPKQLWKIQNLTK